MQRKRVLTRAHLSRPPSICPKPNCGGSYFVPHEEGWQCWNCMKIIYRDQPLLFYIAKGQDDRA